MECTLAAVSDFAYTDRATGKQYILGIIRYIWAARVPTTHGRLAVTFALEEETRSTRQPVLARLHIQDADGGDITPPSPEIQLPFVEIGPASFGRSLCQITIELNNIALAAFGDYAVLLKRGETEVLARARFSVQPFPPSPPAAS